MAVARAGNADSGAGGEPNRGKSIGYWLSYRQTGCKHVPHGLGAHFSGSTGAAAEQFMTRRLLERGVECWKRALLLLPASSINLMGLDDDGVAHRAAARLGAIRRLLHRAIWRR